MDIELLVLCLLTFVIHLIGTLAYAVRIAGVRTRRIAVSFSLFNILQLVSRTSNSFLGPFLAKRVEENLHRAGAPELTADFRWLLVSATLATLVGAVLIPTCQRLFSAAVWRFQTDRSVPRLLLHAVSRQGLVRLRESLAVPRLANLTALRRPREVSTRVLLLNVAAMALWTVGTFASLFAAYLDPDLRVTSSNLSSIVNGVATILLFVFIDPHVSMLTDDVVEGRLSEPGFRRSILWLVGSRLAGTLLAQWLLLPAAMLIAFVAARL